MTAGTISQRSPLIKKNRNPNTPNLLIHLVKRFGFLFSFGSISIHKIAFSAKIFKQFIYHEGKNAIVRKRVWLNIKINLHEYCSRVLVCC